MITYYELMREKYLLGTPKEQWENLEKMDKDAINGRINAARAAELLEGIKATPDNAPLSSVRILIESALRPINDASSNVNDASSDQKGCKL